jgi:hypothetical protein
LAPKTRRTAPTKKQPPSPPPSIEWAEPPPPKKGGNNRRSKFIPLLEEARANPGKSLVIRASNSGVANNIKTGNYQGIEKGEFQVTTRVTPDAKRGTVDIYVKFVGKKK